MRWVGPLVAAIIGALLIAPMAVTGQEADTEELPPPGTLLQPGRYSSSAVGPTIEFRVEQGWISAGPAEGPIFTMERADPPGTILTITRFDGAAFVESCDASSLTDVEVSVPRLIEIIAGNPYLNAAPPKVIQVDGYPGLSLDVATPPFEDCALPFLLLWALSIDDGEFVQVADQQARFIALDVDGDVVVVAIESFPGVPFGTLLDASMDVVDSMRITPGEYVPASPAPVPEPSTEPSVQPIESAPPSSPNPDAQEQEASA